jgi:hypothetical protein
MKAPHSLLLVIALACPLGAHAQAPGAGVPAGCTVREHVPPAELGGEWQVHLREPGSPPGRVREQGLLGLERHPEYTDGVRGTLLLGTGGQMRRSQVSGDVTEGEFHLDESDDGRTISAVWSGQALRCAGALVITGSRRPAGGVDAPDPELAFRLTRQPGWR